MHIPSHEIQARIALVNATARVTRGVLHSNVKRVKVKDGEQSEVAYVPLTRYALMRVAVRATQERT